MSSHFYTKDLLNQNPDIPATAVRGVQQQQWEVSSNSSERSRALKASLDETKEPSPPLHHHVAMH